MFPFDAVESAVKSSYALTCAGLLALALLPLTANAGDRCEHQRAIDLRFDARELTGVNLKTAAGSEIVRGTDGSQVEIVGQACASSEKILAATTLETDARGDTLFVHSHRPETQGSFWRDEYAYIDLEVRMPRHLALKFSDSSGPVEIDGVQGGLDVADSSGSLEIANTGGPLVLEDSSGSITIRHHSGSVLVESDSSGDMDIEDIRGSVKIRRDSSGGITIDTVTGDVWIGKDSSGSITVNDIGGDFTVEKDGSGSIRHNGVNGHVDIPENKRD